MEEMYLLSVIGNIGEISGIMLFFCGICVLLFGIFTAIVSSGASGFGDEIED